jgi:hypothetical protein
MRLVDLQLCLGMSNKISNALECEADRYPYRTDWHYIYSYGPNNGPPFLEQDDFIEWNNDDLRVVLPDTKFTVCLHALRSLSCKCKLPTVPLYAQISSQLLLYRITATFGMPPAEAGDSDMAPWVVNLYHQDGDSNVTFGDDKGFARVYFFGTRKPSNDALRLLNYLVGSTSQSMY